MSGYVPTDWQDGVTPVDATRMDHLEAGVDTADAAAAAAAAALPAKEDKAEKGAVNGYAPLDSAQKVPAANLPALGSDLSFDGDWAAGTYQDGDTVVKDGVVFLCVGGPTAIPPDASLWGGLAQNPVIPAVVNGKWIKGVGGAMVWSDIASDDIKTGRLATDGQLVTDWNTATTDGFYRSANTSANAPLALHLMGIVVQYDGGQVVQEVWPLFQQPIGEAAPRYQRRMINSAWGPWIRQPGILARFAGSFSIVNRTDEVTFFTVLIPANSMGIDRQVRIAMIADLLRANNTDGRIRVKFNGTTEIDMNMTAGATGGRKPWWVDFVIGPAGVTNVQRCLLKWMKPDEVDPNPTTGTGYGTYNSQMRTGILAASTAYNTAADLTITFTYQWAGANSNELRLFSAAAELV